MRFIFSVKYSKLIKKIMMLRYVNAFNVLFIEISLISSVYYEDINAWQDIKVTCKYCDHITELGSLQEASCLVVRFRIGHDQCC